MIVSLDVIYPTDPDGTYTFFLAFEKSEVSPEEKEFVLLQMTAAALGLVEQEEETAVRYWNPVAYKIQS